MTEKATPLLEMQGIDKSFPGVRALSGVDFDLRRGEVHALVGENGAGKSTLMNILGGAVPPDSGTLRIDGEIVEVVSPAQAQDLGISVIHQELNLIPALSVRENLFLGKEHHALGLTGFLKLKDLLRLIDGKRETERARELMDQVGIGVDPATRVADLSVAQQQGVEIAKALNTEARILVMDEPSSALSAPEIETLFAIINQLVMRGLGIIYISHRLNEIEQIAHRVTVLRDGESVRTLDAADVERDQLIEAMVGRRLDQEFPEKESEQPGQALTEVRLRIRDLRHSAAAARVSFDVHRGEILGVAGLEGSGRTQLARLVFGADPAHSGKVELDGETLEIKNPRQAIQHGICLLTEDRKAHGLILDQSLRANVSLANLEVLSRWGLLKERLERRRAQEHRDSLRIKAPGIETKARHLSGGNQQKVVLAKWLERDAEVLIFDEPTRGIDVGAKYEIYALMRKLAARGKCILMISSELPEILGMSDRILVMRDGEIAGVIREVGSATQADVLALAVGA